MSPKRRARSSATTPTSRNDPVLALITDYYFACDVMHDRLWEVAESFFDIKTRETVEKEFRAYLNFWLSSLWVVAHAFQYVLKLDDPIINNLIEDHFGSLSLYRNATFHYQSGASKQSQFFGGGQLNWAEDLHNEFDRYFRVYVAKIGAERP